MKTPDAASVDLMVKRVEKMMRLRHAMQGAEVPVVLISWMREVESALMALARGDDDE